VPKGSWYGKAGRLGESTTSMASYGISFLCPKFN